MILQYQVKFQKLSGDLLKMSVTRHSIKLTKDSALNQRKLFVNWFLSWLNRMMDILETQRLMPWFSKWNARQTRMEVIASSYSQKTLTLIQLLTRMPFFSGPWMKFSLRSASTTQHRCRWHNLTSRNHYPLIRLQKPQQVLLRFCCNPSFVGKEPDSSESAIDTLNLLAVNEPPETIAIKPTINNSVPPQKCFSHFVVLLPSFRCCLWWWLWWLWQWRGNGWLAWRMDIFKSHCVGYPLQSSLNSPCVPCNLTNSTEND